MATLVQPLAGPFQECKARAGEVLKAQGYTGFLEFGNGWIAHARGTSVSVACIPGGGRTIVVIVSAGGQLVRESKRIWEELRGPEGLPEPAPGAGSAPAAPGSGWNATASDFGGPTGTRYNFWCPPNGSPAPVWGDRIYSAVSSVCTAAVHAGTLTFLAGGNAIIELGPGLAAYAASTRNGVTTLAGGSAGASFTFVGRP